MGVVTWLSHLAKTNSPEINPASAPLKWAAKLTFGTNCIHCICRNTDTKTSLPNSISTAIIRNIRIDMLDQFYRERSDENVPERKIENNIKRRVW